MGQLQGDTGGGPLLTTALYTYTFLLRHHSFELPCVFRIIVLVLNGIEYRSNFDSIRNFEYSHNTRYNWFTE